LFKELDMTFFNSFFRRRKPSTPPSNPPTDTLHSSGELPSPQVTSLKTLIIVYDPVMDLRSGKKLSEYMRWNLVEDLARGYMTDILQTSGGLARYQIVQRVDVDGFPAKVDGHYYNAQTYLDVIRGVSRPYMPQEADYYAIIDRFNVLQRIASREIDEVWVFNFPHAGFYESIMGGPGPVPSGATRRRSGTPKQRDGVLSSWDFPMSAASAKCSRTWGTAPSPFWKRHSRG
jgi:hypothetical protein